MGRARGSKNTCCRETTWVKKRTYMKQLLEYLLTQITGKEISVEEREEDGRTILEIEPGEETIGLVIGKGGKTIKALQEIVRVCARKENKFVYLRIKDQSPS